MGRCRPKWGPVPFLAGSGAKVLNGGLKAWTKSTRPWRNVRRQRVHQDVVPALVAGTAYRIVQEGLTNARKHAPGMPVTVTVDGAAGRGLAVRVRQPLAVGDAGIPGSGVGLTGLAERATLAGGVLEHGPKDGEFVLCAHLPWEG